MPISTAGWGFSAIVIMLLRPDYTVNKVQLNQTLALTLSSRLRSSRLRGIGAGEVNEMGKNELLLHWVLGRVTWLLGPMLCRLLIMQPIRRELAREWPDNVIGPTDSLNRLQYHCQLCGRCGMARIKAPPHYDNQRAGRGHP